MNLNGKEAGLHIVIPTFNGWQQTRRCLLALRESTCQDFHVIVVDHGSTDETKPALLTEFPEVECVLGDESLWWAGATNLGIRQAIASSAQRIMLLNNDCYMTPDTIGKLLQYSDQCNDISIVAPLTKDLLSGKVLNLGFTTCLWLGFPSIRLPSICMPRQSACEGLITTRLIMGGRGVIIPTKVFQQIGLLDEKNLPHYLADHDFYLRCQKAGISLMIAMDAQLSVDNTRTTIANQSSNMTFMDFRETWSSRKSHRNLKDLKAFFKKHYPIRLLYPLGVGLNFVRYTLQYVGTRLLNFKLNFFKKNKAKKL